MAKHAVVRTDLMSGTDVRSDLVSVRYMDGEDVKEIDNGNVVRLDSLIKDERELFKGVTPKKTDALEDIVLIATPEVMYDERLRNLDEYYNDVDRDCRGYRLHEGDIFSVTAEALEGAESAEKGNVVELGDSTKLKVSTEATGTVVGSILDIEQAGPFKYYAIIVTPSATNTAATPEPTIEEKIKIMDQSTDITGLNKKVSDLIETDVKIGKDGAVTGTLKYITSWTEFSNDSAEQSGNFIPVKLDEKYKNQQITCVGTHTKTAQDIEWVLRVKDVNSTFKFSVQGGEDIVTLSFKGATLKGAET